MWRFVQHGWECCVSSQHGASCMHSRPAWCCATLELSMHEQICSCIGKMYIFRLKPNLLHVFSATRSLVPPFCWVATQP